MIRPLARPSLLRISSSGGYTLMELMIVVVIVGLLSAVAIPQYLRTRTISEAAAIVAETLALANQCALGSKSTIPQTVNQTSDGAAVVCDGQAQRQINSRSWSGDATGLECLDRTANANHRRVRVTVSVGGNMTCRFLT